MKKEEMVLTAGQKDTGGRVPLKWVGPEGERIPTPRKTTYPLMAGFKAAGKYYPGIRQLILKEEGPALCTDRYGREVICLKERFPCFDSYDYLYENRYYRWYFLRHEGRLTVVYRQDEGKTVEVTEDADRIKDWQWQEIRMIWKLD